MKSSTTKALDGLQKAGVVGALALSGAALYSISLSMGKLRANRHAAVDEQKKKEGDE